MNPAIGIYLQIALLLAYIIKSRSGHSRTTILCHFEYTPTQVMASSNDKYLCNGVPVDHRLKRFLPSAKVKHAQGIGKHADIIESFGNTMVRDDETYPSPNEAGFAA